MLALPEVTIDDSFFALGGDSLTSLRLAGRVRSALGVDLDLRLLFRHPTVASLEPRLKQPTTAAPRRPALRRMR